MSDDKSKSTDETKDAEKSSFDEIMEQNKKKKEKLEKERKEANKNVLKSYRIK